MSLEQTLTVDAVGIEGATGHCVLTICDAFDWEDSHNHLEALQAKINSYLDFIQGGQICESYPDSAGRRLVIDILFRFDLPNEALDFLATAADVVKELDVDLRYRVVSVC